MSRMKRSFAGDPAALRKTMARSVWSDHPGFVLRPLKAQDRRGQSVILRGREAPSEGAAYAVCSGVVIASGLVEQGEFMPNRVFNLPF
jgi:hypothetical protein